MDTFENALPAGTLLDNRYKIESVLGEGGFGITYKAHDQQLDYTVVIKEFLPQECAARSGDSVTVQPRTNRTDDYQYGLERFLDEARHLAKFQHANIVRVSNFINTNGTVYFVMDYAEGEDLSDWLKKHEVLNEDIILKIITPILEGLAEVHKAGLMHRDIKPGNIFMRKQGGPMLIDFGAARQALGEHSKSISAIISQGYAPPEQYTTRGKQGPFTDLYAIGAVLYKLITGKAPLESADRAHDIHEGEPDPMVPTIEAGKGKVGDWLLQLTDQLLRISAKDRPQNAEAVLVAIKNKTIAVGCAARTETQAEPDNKTRVVRSGERFDKKSKRQPEQNTSSAHGAPYGKIAAVIVVIAAIAGGGWWFSQNDTADVGANSFAQNGENNAAKQSKTLAKGNAILYVDSQPADAEIYLDNILLGRTPYKNEALPKGEHEIKLSHASAETHKEKLVLKDNVIVKKAYKLNPASGTVSLFSTPEGASIQLDGKDTGKKTPVTLESVSTGEHQITLSKDTYYPKQISINVFKGKASREDVTLEGGHLVGYEGEWLAPGEKEKRIAKAKQIVEQKAAETMRIAEQKAAEAEEAKLIAKQNAREQQAANYRKQAKAKAEQGEIEAVQSLLTKAAKLRKNESADKEIFAYVNKQYQAQQRLERLGGRMVHIPAGSLQLAKGTLDEKPIDKMKVAAFKLAKHEVTKAQFARFIGATNYKTDAEKNASSKDGCFAYKGNADWGWKSGNSWRDPGFQQKDNEPVVCVSWNDAQAYIKWLSKDTGRQLRLPSDAEWEYAVRAGGSEKDHLNGYKNKLCDYANMADQAFKQVFSWAPETCNDNYIFTAPVGSYKVNAYGLNDMLGNVKEWTQDCAGGTQSNSICRKRVSHGSSWNHTSSISSVSLREPLPSTDRYFTVGFRLAQSLE